MIALKSKYDKLLTNIVIFVIFIEFSSEANNDESYDAYAGAHDEK